MSARLKLLFVALAIAVFTSGCAVATDLAHKTSSICQLSTDGGVSCGGRATGCMGSADGRSVACGGAATVCLKSIDGHSVACGGRADYCAKSTDGGAAACGGAADYCEKAASGLACGGMYRPRMWR